MFYRIKEADGGMIAGFSGLADPPKASHDPIFYDVDYAGNALRAVALTLPFSRGNQPVDIEPESVRPAPGSTSNPLTCMAI
ncbi:sensor histidine kinase N-terminal domain-containing protein [Peptostreptococcus porci]|uniref:sensor histidine kinase N-terminal domain-containing protein n=1 Tax=Peptostreptococcus porci TaxID=2652282 RepID=UPI0038CD4140